MQTSETKLTFPFLNWSERTSLLPCNKLTLELTLIQSNLTLRAVSGHLSTLYL